MSAHTSERAGRVMPSPRTQLALGFVSMAEIEAQHTAHEQRVQTQQKRKPSRSPLVTLIDCTTADVYELPLFQSLKGVEAERFVVDPLQSPEHVPEDDLLPDDEVEKARDIDLIADHAFEFVGWYIERNMEMLASVGNAQEKASVLEWMFEPDVELKQPQSLQDYRQPIAIHKDRVPFSFQWCCKVVGFDPDRFRDALLDTIRGAMENVSPRHQAAYKAFLAKASERYS